MKNPLTKIGKISFVKLKNALGKINIRSEKWKIPSVKMKNPVDKNGISAQ
jgi:hypothetical protein